MAAFPCFALYSNFNCSNPSLCEPAKTAAFGVLTSPVKLLRSASWSTRFQETPAFEETYRPPSRSLTTNFPGDVTTVPRDPPEVLPQSAAMDQLLELAKRKYLYSCPGRPFPRNPIG